jgi:hypothetical protein
VGRWSRSRCVWGGLKKSRKRKRKEKKQGVAGQVVQKQVGGGGVMGVFWEGLTGVCFDGG